jgi:hypothetical protein
LAVRRWRGIVIERSSSVPGNRPINANAFGHQVDKAVCL